MKKINRKYIFWILLILAVAIFCGVVGVALYPFVSSFVLAYLFLPVVNTVEKRGIHRGIGSGVIVLLGFAIIILTIAALIPFLYSKLWFFIQEFIINNKDPITLDRMKKLSNLINVDADLIYKAHDYIIGHIRNIDGSDFTSSTRTTINMIITIIATIFVMPIIMFYMLKDWYRMRSIFYHLIPETARSTIKIILSQIDDSIASFLRGQISLCVFYMIFYSIALHLTGLGMGFLLGIMVGAMIFIPYVGFFTGITISLIIAFIQYGMSDMFFVICGIFVLGQLIDANYTTPKFLGDKVGLHPVLIVFGLFASAKVFGITGAILALPITTTTAILLKFCITKYKNSYYYN